MKTNDKKAKIFICHHPASLIFYKNLAKVAKKDRKTKVVLFKINHLYFKRFDFRKYQSSFDKILEFNFINYRPNIIKGYWDIIKFKKKIRKAMKYFPGDFYSIDIFASDSAWLPINIMICELKKYKNVKNFFFFKSSSHLGPQIKTDRLKTFLCFLYTLPLRCYEVKVLSTLAGKFLDFVYKEKPAGEIIKVVNPTSNLLKINNRREKIIPYPFLSQKLKTKIKNIVIVFGDSEAPKEYKEYVPDKKEFLEKMKLFFRALEKKYVRCDLYYKPHPANKKLFMEGINPEKYKLFGLDISSEVIFDSMASRIKATYSFCSTSAISSSFYNIPSYTFYRLSFNNEGRKKWDNFFLQDGLDSKFIFHIENIKEIGIIDNIKGRRFDYTKNKERYFDILKLT